MLWRKHWREVRWIALFAAVGQIALGCYLLADVGTLQRQYVAPSADGLVPATYRLRPISFHQASQGYLMGGLPAALIAAAILLGIGGLGYERSAGTSVFTLSLPFSRRRLVVNRFVVGATALALLAFGAVAGTLLWAVVRGVGIEFPPWRAVGLALCLTVLAIAIYAFAFLAANVTAHAVRSIATVVTLIVVLGIGVESPMRTPDRWTAAWFLGPLNFVRMVALSDDLVRTGSMPWAGVAIALAIAVGLALVTVRWVERYDF